MICAQYVVSLSLSLSLSASSRLYIYYGIMQVLSVQQLYKICTQYWDDKYNTESVSEEVTGESLIFHFPCAPYITVTSEVLSSKILPFGLFHGFSILI
jgi:hypothetical protein